jgi:hypothetical protein
MPLTRHLYEIDEVVSALQICLRNRWPRGLFWLWELVVSKEETLALTTLQDIWLYRGGGVDPALLELPHESWVERYVRVSEAMGAAYSLNAERFLTLTASMDSRPTMTPIAASTKVEARRRQRAAAFVADLDPAETISKEDAAAFWISLDSACRQGRRTDAVWLLQAAQQVLSADAIWSALRIAARGGAGPAIDLMQRSASAHPLQQILFQTNATLHLCIPTADRTSLPKPSIRSAAASWASWTTMVGRRAARIYPIPTEALHAETTRGQIPFKYTNIEDLRVPVPLLTEGCQFWQEAVAAAGVTATDDSFEFPTDDALEQFYDEHFPDDIPDEWSKQDQEKSHGRGCHEKVVPPAFLVKVREEPVSQRAWNCGIGVRGFAAQKR